MKDKNTAAILALFLGGVGAHKFYLQRTAWGIVYLLLCWTFVPALIALPEAIILLAMSKERFDAKYNAGVPAIAAIAPQNIVVNVANSAHAGMLPSGDVAGQLKALHELKVSGALSEQEFAEQKQKLLTAVK